jgi:hypothetical protein
VPAGLSRGDVPRRLARTSVATGRGRAPVLDYRRSHHAARKTGRDGGRANPGIPAPMSIMKSVGPCAVAHPRARAGGSRSVGRSYSAVNEMQAAHSGPLNAEELEALSSTDCRTRTRPTSRPTTDSSAPASAVQLASCQASICRSSGPMRSAGIGSGFCLKTRVRVTTEESRFKRQRERNRVSRAIITIS